MTTFGPGRPLGLSLLSLLSLALSATAGCRVAPAEPGPGSSSGSESSATEAGSSGTHASETTDDSDSSDTEPWEPILDTVPGWVCNPKEPDCAEDERCRPCARDGLPACVPVADAPGAKDEPCTIDIVGDLNVDDCGPGLMCRDLDDLGTLTCVELCGGTTLEPTCSSPDEACSAEGNLGCNASVCRPTCDPISQDCGPGQACFVDAHAFSEVPVCVPQWVWSAELGQPCSADLLNSCAPGSMCGDGPLPGCVPQEFTGCCTPYCSVDLQDCPFANEGVICAPYDPSPPPGYEYLGVCVAP